jgi:hypothetical protein
MSVPLHPIGRAGAALCVALAACASTRTPTTLTGACVEGTEGCVAVLDGTELVTAYRFRDQRVPALYPLLAPGGVPVTRGFPFEERPDEERGQPHHASLWLAHGDVNGNDFWRGSDTRIENGDAVLCDAGAGEACVRARNLWIAREELVLIEDRVMTFHLRKDVRVIDFDFVLSPAVEAVTFGDTPEGTFAMRMHPELRLVGPVAKGSVRNSEGVAGPAVWGQRARWIAYSGPVGGQMVTVAMMDHPKNLRHPTWWNARDHGLCAANPFGMHAFADAVPAAGAVRVSAGEVMRLRYRVVLAAGKPDDGDLDDLWEAFAAAG